MVEKDWTSASYFLALGAVAGEVNLPRLKLSSLQGDKVIVDLLLKMGADIKIGPDLITVKKAHLRAIQADLSNCIDLLPTMAAVSGVSRRYQRVYRYQPGKAERIKPGVGRL